VGREWKTKRLSSTTGRLMRGAINPCPSKCSCCVNTFLATSGRKQIRPMSPFPTPALARWCAATYCTTLLRTATHCSTLQHTVTHCHTLRHMQHTATHGNTRQHTATHCNTLQHTATHCSTLFHCSIL